MTLRRTPFFKVMNLSMCAGIAAALLPIGAATAADTAKQAVTTPFQIHVAGTVDGFFCGATYTVPAGVRVYIKYVGYRSESKLSGQITIGGEFNVSPAFQTYLNPLQGNFTTVFNETLFTGGQTIVAEADPGSVIGVGYYFSQSDSTLSCEVGLSGHMETVP